jgi:UrcA family protein
MKNHSGLRCMAALLAMICSGTSLADETAPMTTVKYADLNLASRSGIAALYQRIDRATAEVCQLPQGTRQLKLETELKACRAQALDRAVAEANLPQLSALHAAKTRKVDAAQYAERR